MTRFIISFGLLISLCSQVSAAQLVRDPDIHQNTLVFAYANDIYKSSIAGGDAKRLTNFQGREYGPEISPDGELIAFTGQYAGNADVYLVSANGGNVTRLTFHPGKDEVVGWSPDGKSVLFRTTRNNAPRSWDRLYTIAIEGGNPTELPMNRAFDGAFDSTGQQLVFRRPGSWDAGWRNYRGGQNQPLRIIDLNDLSESDIPFDNDAIFSPTWEGEEVFYLSNASQVTNVFKYHTKTRQVAQVTQSDDWDVKSYAVDGENIVYEYLGDFYLQRGDAQPEKIELTITANFHWLREQYVNAAEQLTEFNISPNGKRAVVSARGDIFTVPVEHGSIRNLTDTSGYRETNPAWSNKGDRIAWFSDESGEYQLIIADQFGQVSKTISLAERGFYSELSWSPDDARVVFSDNYQQLWVANTDNGSTLVIAQNLATHPDPRVMASWSADSKYLAYVLQNENMFRELFIYDVQARESTKVSSGLAEIVYPTWDESGDKLYFLASTDFGPNAAWLDMSTLSFDPSYHLYHALVNDQIESPLLPMSDDEELKPAKEDDEKEDGDEENKKETVSVELTTLIDRVMPLPGSAGHFSNLTAGKDGHLFYLSRYTKADGTQSTDLMRYSLEDKKATSIVSGVRDYRLSGNRESILVRKGENWLVFPASGKSGEDDKKLKMNLQKRVVFAEEWQQIFIEAWRFQRDYLYVDNFHGADWDKVYETYQPLVASANHPADFTYLLDMLGAEVSIGHSYTNFGDLPDIDANKIGLLGADFEISDNAITLTKAYTGENYFPSQNLQAPLAMVAHQLPENAQLLKVNGKSLDPAVNFYSYFEGTLGQQTSLTFAAANKGEEPITVTVIPIANETSLRRNDWVESNRRYVDEQSDGKLAYVWIPNTAGDGYTTFNRYYFAQQDRQGVVLDQRFNHGGFIANYIIDVLRRELNGFFNNQFDQSRPLTSPGSGIWGSQVMLINEVSGSGGDMLPYMFRFYDLGPLIGKRTWGGLVGIWGVPSLIDGGSITAPRSGFYDLQGEWKVENEGVAPDIDVDQWTKYTAAGNDPQLDKAIEEAMKGLKEDKTRILSQPQPPVRVPLVN